MNRSRREKQPRHGKVYPQLRTFFFKERKEKPEKVRSSPPRKNPGFSGSVPLERSVLCHPKNKNFPGIAVFCQPEDKNFPKTASFIPSDRQKFSENRHFLPTGGQKFPGNRHFLPTGGQEFPENGQFHASRKTKKMNPATIFLRLAGKSRPKFLPQKIGNPKKISEKLKTELHVHNQNRDFSMQQGK